MKFGRNDPIMSGETSSLVGAWLKSNLTPISPEASRQVAIEDSSPVYGSRPKDAASLLKPEPTCPSERRCCQQDVSSYQSNVSGTVKHWFMFTRPLSTEKRKINESKRKSQNVHKTKQINRKYFCSPKKDTRWTLSSGEDSKVSVQKHYHQLYFLFYDLFYGLGLSEVNQI